MFFIMGFGMYLSHKINLTQNLIMGNTINPLSAQFGLRYGGIILMGFIMVIIAYFLIIKEK